MWIKDMITLDESDWYFNKFSPRITTRIRILMLGFKGLRELFPIWIDVIGGELFQNV